MDHEQELAAEQAYFDHARDVREAKRHSRAGPVPGATGKDASLLTRARRERVAAMRPASEAPAFGRIDTENGATYYIGYDSIIDADTQDVLVVNWKTEVGRLYELAAASDPHGVGRKRSFECHEHKIVDFTDYVFADLAARISRLAEEPEYDDALLAELERSRTGEMRDVVKTIQASQTPVMRSPLDGVLLVQGAPGTGKTVVALHRVSWLLYNYSDHLTADRVLVVGPNPTFTRYIRGVLPALGDRDVRQLDITALGPAVRLGRREDHAVTVLKGRAQMADLLARGLRQRIGMPTGAEPLTLRVSGHLITFDRDRLADRLRSLASAVTYMEGRRQFRAFLMEEIQRDLRIPTAELRAELLDNLLDRIWPQYTAVSFLQGFLGSRERLLRAAGDEFTAREITMLLRRPAERLSDETWSPADVFLLDELESMLNGVPADELYGHIVIDEAQDLSPMQLRAVARRAATGSMTVVGDIAQSTGPWARESWDDVVRHLPGDVRRAELEYGYRVPRQVFELAAKLLPRIAADLTPPLVVRDGPEDPDYQQVEPADLASAAVTAARHHAGYGRSVGVIATAEHAEAVGAAFRANNVEYDDASQGQLGGSINVVAPRDAKGLEFDAVVLVEPESIVAEEDAGERMLYVALTRTTKYLTVVHAGAPLPLADASARPGGPDAADEPGVPATTSNGAGGRRRRPPDPAHRPRPNRLVLAIARDLADQVEESLTEDSWETVIETLIDELDQRRAR